MPAVGRGRPVLTTYLTRVPIGASLTLGRPATAATQLRAFNPWFASVKPPTLCSAGDGTLVGYSRFPSFGAPVRADQVLGTGVLAKARTRTELKGRPFRRPFFVHQHADQASHRSVDAPGRANRSGGEHPPPCLTVWLKDAGKAHGLMAGATALISVEKSDAIVEAECRYKGRAFLHSPTGTAGPNRLRAAGIVAARLRD
jgi:hypothetical protein